MLVIVNNYRYPNTSVDGNSLLGYPGKILPTFSLISDSLGYLLKKILCVNIQSSVKTSGFTFESATSGGWKNKE